MTPENIVQQNLDAYNSQNIDAFMACLSDAIQLFNLGEKEASLVGRIEVKEFYAELFENSPCLCSTILKRIVIGNKVIDHESIVGRNGSDEMLELVLVYEVEVDKISKITVIRP